MAKFAIGEKVDNAADGHEGGTVIAVFPTVDGNFRYAVDMEGYGALQFFCRRKTSRSRLLGWNAPCRPSRARGCAPRNSWRPYVHVAGGSMSGASGVRSSGAPSPSTFDLTSAALSIRAADILGSLVALAIQNRIVA